MFPSGKRLKMGGAWSGGKGNHVKAGDANDTVHDHTTRNRLCGFAFSGAESNGEAQNGLVRQSRSQPFQSTGSLVRNVPLEKLLCLSLNVRACVDVSSMSLATAG